MTYLIASFLLIVFPLLAAPITVYLAGDSTMAEKLPEKRPETGWGEALQSFFDNNKVQIENHAKNGRSTRTFIEENLWQAIIDKVKKGDYVFIEFGHNDAAKDRTERYTPPEDYRKNLIRFITEVRQKDAIPVLLTPVMRRRFDKDGNFQDSHGEYPDIVRAVAVEKKVALIDMHRRSETVLKQYVMSVHAEEEMDEDGLTIFDVESVILTGEIVDRQREPQTRTRKYVVRG